MGQPAAHRQWTLLLLRTGCAWRYLPQEYGPWQTYIHANWAKPNELSIFGSGHTHPDIVPSIEVN